MNFGKNIFLIIILFLLSFLIYSAYKIYYLPDNISNKFYVYCFILSLIGSVFFIYGFKFKKSTQENLSLILLSAIFTVYFIEVIFHFQKVYLTTHNYNKSINDIRKSKAKKLNIFYDSRTKSAVISDLKKQGINVIPKFYPIQLLKDKKTLSGIGLNDPKIFPLGDVSNKTVVEDNENGYWMKFQTDKYGFHNEKIRYEKKSIDIIIIGDSFAEGSSVRSEKNIASLIETKGFNVLNFGKAGHGPLLEYAIFLEYVKKFKPKKLLWLYHVNDIYNLIDEKKSPLLFKYLNEENFSQNLISKQDKINEAIFNYTSKQKKLFEEKNDKPELEYKFLSHFKNILLLRNIRSKFGLEGLNKGIVDPSDLKSFENILNKVNKTLKSWDGELYFVYLPRHSSHYNLGKLRFLSLKKRHEHREQVLKVVKKLDITIIDLVTELFAKHPDPLSLFPFRMFGHYNAKGYELVTDEILKNLKNIEYDK